MKVGGRHGGSICETVFLFDCGSRQWHGAEKEKPSRARLRAGAVPSLGPRFAHTAVHVSHRPDSARSRTKPDSFIYVFGGYKSRQDSTPCADVFLYHVKQKCWYKKDVKIGGRHGGLEPPARAYHASCLSPCNNYIVVHGGNCHAFAADPVMSDTLFLYDIHNAKWLIPVLNQRSEKPPSARRQHSLVNGVGRHEGSMVLYGGCATNAAYSNHMYTCQLIQTPTNVEVVWEKIDVKTYLQQPLSQNSQRVSEKKLSKRRTIAGGCLIAVPHLAKYVMVGGRGEYGIRASPLILEPFESDEIALSQSVQVQPNEEDDDDSDEEMPEHAPASPPNGDLAQPDAANIQDDFSSDDDDIFQPLNTTRLSRRAASRSVSAHRSSSVEQPNNSLHDSRRVSASPPPSVSPQKPRTRATNPVTSEQPAPNASVHAPLASNILANGKKTKPGTTTREAQKRPYPDTHEMDIETPLAKKPRSKTKPAHEPAQPLSPDLFETQEDPLDRPHGPPSLFDSIVAPARRARAQSAKAARGRGARRGRGGRGGSKAVGRSEQEVKSMQESWRKEMEHMKTNLEKEKQVLRTEKDKFVNENKQLNDEIKSLIDEVKSLRRKQTSEATKVSRSAAGGGTSRQKPRHIDSSLDSMEHDSVIVHLSPSKVEKGSEALQVLRAECSRLQNDYDQIVQEKDNISSTVEQLEEGKQSVEKQLNVVKNKLQKMTIDRDAMRKERDVLRKDSAEETKTKEEAEHRRRSAEEDKSMLKREIERLKLELKEQKRKLSDEGCQLSNAGRMVKDVQGQLANANKRFENFDGREKRLRDEVQAEKGKNKELQKQLDQATKVKEKGEEENIAIAADCETWKRKYDDKLKECSVALIDAERSRDARDKEKKHKSDADIEQVRMKQELERTKKERCAFRVMVQNKERSLRELMPMLTHITKTMGELVEKSQQDGLDLDIAKTVGERPRPASRVYNQASKAGGSVCAEKDSVSNANEGHISTAN